MPNSNSPKSRAQRAANAREWERARKAEGYRRVCLILNPAAAARLEELASQFTPASKNAAIEKLLGCAKNS